MPNDNLKEDVYVKGPTGAPLRIANEEAARQAIASGSKVISKEEAESSQKAGENLDYVDQKWGATGKLGMGLLSGVSLGLAPGALASAGIVDPGHLRAAEASPFYTAGDIGGTVLPALLSGGESLGARGLMRATPAGLMEMAGSATERLVGGVLGSEAGTLGRLASTPARMAARGATDGALINLGHTVGDALAENKPLATESLLASSADGALFGAFLGGSLGTVGSLGAMAAESVGSLAKTAAGSKAAEGAWLRRIGKTEGDAAEIIKSGGTKEYAKELNEVLKRGETRIGDSDAGLKAGSTKARESFAAERAEIVETLQKNAPQDAPTVDRIQQRIKAEVLAPVVGTTSQTEVEAVVNRANKLLENLAPSQVLEDVKVPAKTAEKYQAGGPGKGKYVEYEVEPAYEIKGGTFPSSEKPTWQKWIESRDHLSKEFVGSPIKQQITDIVNDELVKSMQTAEMNVGEAVTGLADKYAAATARLKIAEELEESLGSRAAQKLMSTKPVVSTEELAYAGLMAANGNPIAAGTFVLGKGIIKMAKELAEPAIAQMAFDMSVGAKAATAQSSVKGRISKSLGNFFSNTTKTPSKAATTYVSSNKSKPKEKGLTRDSYEALASKTEQLLSNAHQDKVRRYTEMVYNLGYKQMAMRLMEANARATNYLLYNMPARQGTKNLTSLRKLPASAFPTLQEYKFSRMVKGVTEPLSVVEDIEKGNVSREQVMAMKYVYPELHSEIVMQASEKIYEMKQEGNFMPMDKITKLSIVLGYPLDSTQTPEYMGAVQRALNSPPADLPPEEQPQTPMAPIDMQTLMTATQKVQMV